MDSNLRKQIMEELKDKAYSFKGLQKRFEYVKASRLAEEVILLASQQMLELRFGADGSIFFAMKGG